jgi:hypothetical protein
MYPRERRPLPSPATCIALLALFVSLGGTTYAVTSLPRDSVGPEQLRDRAVTEDKLSNASVITRKLANGSVTARKLAREGITGSRIAPNALGGDQIDESLLGAVPRAENAEQANRALRAAVADRVERVERAETAGSADTAALAQKAAEADRAGHADQADLASLAVGLTTVDTNFVAATFDQDGVAVIEIPCDDPVAQVAINGGFEQTGDEADVPVTIESRQTVTGWRVRVFELIDPSVPMSGRGYGICVNRQPAP